MPTPRVPLNPAQIDELLEGVTTQLIHTLPANWEQLFITFRSVGSYVEMPVQLINLMGQVQPWQPPDEVLGAFAGLRHGMYREGEGTWFSARYHLVHFAKVGVEYNWTDEPDWDHTPPAEFFREELETYPRDEVPEWLRLRGQG
ncbi:hypothetical protein [Saccharopolyspora taberi]|uniref:Uncharacterized protein n=1 Tax=Saccharopolyspora taberi TaxID=60895 RepID=A0ABN3VN38_9PSEU